jgi:hypothetical protein
VPAFAEKLARCKTEEAAKSEMFANPAAAQAFWIWSEALIDGMKKGLISTKAQNPPPTYCVELLAAMVLTYCNHTIQQEGPDFAFEVP